MFFGLFDAMEEFMERDKRDNVHWSCARFDRGDHIALFVRMINQRVPHIQA